MPASPYEPFAPSHLDPIAWEATQSQRLFHAEYAAHASLCATLRHLADDGPECAIDDGDDSSI